MFAQKQMAPETAEEAAEREREGIESRRQINEWQQRLQPNIHGVRVGYCAPWCRCRSRQMANGQ